MGFSFRKRTRGKKSWLNFSGSSRGLRSSISFKLGNATINLSKHGRRGTINFGNGIRYTSYKKNTAKPTNQSSRVTEVIFWWIVIGVIIYCIV